MAGAMTHANSGVSPELWELVSRACNDTLSPEDQARLELLLSADDNGRRFYGYYMLMHGDLLWRFRDGSYAAPEAAHILSTSSAPDEPGIPGYFATVLHGAIGYFPEDMPLAYLIATVVTGLGLLVGSHVYMPRPEQVAHHSARWSLRRKWSSSARLRASRIANGPVVAVSLWGRNTSWPRV